MVIRRTEDTENCQEAVMWCVVYQTHSGAAAGIAWHLRQAPSSRLTGRGGADETGATHHGNRPGGEVCTAMTSDRPVVDLRGTRAAVLGSTSGIGRATALALADVGADVIVHGRSSRARAEAVAAEIQAKGVRAGVVMADLADRDAGDRLVQDAWALWNGLDAWLHIAGADTLTGAAARLPFDAKLDLLWSVDVVATVRLCRTVGKRMTAQGSGSIVTMGWDQAETGMEGDSGELFAVTKGAIMAFTRSLALSLAPAVRVNAIAPGWIKTAWGDGASQPWHDRVLRETPLARWGTPQDVAQAACFLVSPAAAFVTGQVFRVNGGSVR
jgi:3-oxoacyl-[acyl-carrier protein] reductase